MIQGYCWPLSVAPGENISFMISGEGPCVASFNRHISTSALVDSFHMIDKEFLATFQPEPPSEIWSTGCGWAETFPFTIPQDWQSGIYSVNCTDSEGAESNITFIVKPSPLSRSNVVVLANINTWLAYNDWSGHNRYTGGTHLSFLQPSPNSSPEGLKHLTRGELWILGYMESQGIYHDVYTDIDFHNDGCDANQYKCLVVGTHPEYWSVQMYDNLKAYLCNGGNLLYLGGNGIYDTGVYDIDQTAMTFLSAANGDHMVAGLFRSSSRPERSILGVATERCTVEGSAYRVRLENQNHFLFDNTGLGTGIGETLLFGEAGLNTFYGNGKASGLEVDTYDGPGALGVPSGTCGTQAGIVPPSIAPGGLVILARENPMPGVGELIWYITIIIQVVDLSFLSAQ